MRAILVTVGSRGDAEPFLSLAASLISEKHTVDIFLQPDHHHLLPAGATLHTLPFTQEDFYRFVATPTHGGDDPNPRVRFTGIVADVIGELVLPCAQKIHSVADGASVIVASSLARQVALAVGEKTGIPICLVQLQPLAATKMFPHYSAGDGCVQAILKGEKEDDMGKNIESYWNLERRQFEFLADRLEQTYKEMELAWDEEYFEKHVAQAMGGLREDVVVVNAFSNGTDKDALIPVCDDHHCDGQNIEEVGALADVYVPEDWKPSTKLASFLENGKRPLCVGYGSMPFDRVSEVVSALKAGKHRAVMVGKGMADKIDELVSEGERGMFLGVDRAPYPWLLPKCEMMLCHGGAGVVHSALRSGIPVVISPLMGDQFFFASLLKAKGLGVQCGSSLTSVTTENISTSIDEAFKCRESCKRMGKNMEGDGHGVELLIGILKRLSK